MWLLLAMALLAGCSLGGKTAPSEFYVLSARQAAPIDDSSPLSVLLGPLSLPDAVQRPQLVTRPEPGRMVFAEYHRWAGDLRANVEQVLLQNLSDRLGSNAVVPAGRSNLEADYRVAMDFQRFDGALGRNAVLEGTWQVRAGNRGCLIGVQRFAIQTPLNGVNYVAYVQGLDEALAQLSDQVAQTLAKRPGCPGDQNRKSLL